MSIQVGGRAMPSSEEMGERLSNILQRFQVAGATAAWMLGDHVESCAAGVLNRGTGVDATPDSVFQIGSITKTYTTTLIMQLVDEGKVELDAPIVSYLPDVRFADPEQTKLVTIRHLLTHTSGVDGDHFEDFGRGDDAVEKYVASCAKLPFVFPVGTMWSYSNAGFVVLGRLIEVLTGMSWDRALKRRLLDPIGAERTLTLPEQALLFRTAAGHFGLVPDAPALSPVWGMPRAQGPAGSTPCSTVEDLLKFARLHLDGGKAKDGTQVLSEAAVRAMQQEQFTLPPQPGEGASHWGLGWMLFDWDGHRIFGHDGGTIGQNSSLRIFPEQNFAVAVLTNTTPNGAVAAVRMMRWLFGEFMGVTLPPPAKPPEVAPDIDLTPYAGTYEKHESRADLTLTDGRLTLQFTNTGPLGAIGPQQPPVPVHPVSETVMLQEVAPGFFQPMTFSQFESGRPKYLYASRVYRRVE